MTSRLNYELVRAQQAEIARQAERSRQERQAFAPESGSPEQPATGGLMVRLRLRRPDPVCAPSR
jgi:hypothetical protein